jgi:hypothetical protein
VLLDSVTFGIIKDRLEELGQVCACLLGGGVYNWILSPPNSTLNNQVTRHECKLQAPALKGTLSLAKASAQPRTLSKQGFVDPVGGPRSQSVVYLRQPALCCDVVACGRRRFFMLWRNQMKSCCTWWKHGEGV